MRCKYCGFTNGDDDHRCLRCGRRVGTAISAPASTSGANALAVAPAFEANETQDFLPIADPVPAQATLFRSSGSNVIPFDQLQRQATGKLQNLPAPPPAKPRTAATEKREAPPVQHEQTKIDFLAAAPPQRVLKTDVPAQIYCNRPVATPTHRFVAGAMDTAMVLLAFGLFVAICELTGTGFGAGKLFWIMMGASFTLIAAFYGLVFAVTGHETAGMHWTDLQLITFDGFPVDGRSRAARVASTWLSFCSAGLGLVWALADEETLTWQDHISKTFPTIRESSSSFVRAGRP
jgi:uncharacterized RDD family membrane protein YckC